MAISYVSVSSNTGLGSTSLTVTAPANVQNNDILVAFGAVWNNKGGANINPPTGFTEIATNNRSGILHCSIAWKRASSESGNYTFGGIDGGYYAACIIVLRGCTTSGSPVDVYSNTKYTYSNDITRAASVTTTVANTMLIAAGQNASPTSFSTPSGMTEVVDVTDGTVMSIFADYVAQASSGSSGNKDALGAETVYKHAFLVAFKPDSAGNPWYAYAQQ